MLDMKEWIHKYKWKFILLYFFPLCWVYKATLCNHFGVSSTISSLMLSSRGLTVILLSSFGWLMMSKVKTSMSVKRALLLSFYMFFVTLLTEGTIDISTIAMLFFWSMTFYITERNVLSESNIGMVAIVASLVCNIMAINVITYYPLISILIQLDHDQHVAASNSIYYVMSASIFIFLIRNNFLKIALLVLPCMAMLLVGKSTCLLAMAVSVCFYFQKMLLHSRSKIWIMAGIVMAVFIAAFFGEGLFNVSDTIAGLGEDVDSGGNGRFEIWTTVLQRYSSSDFFHILFGNGAQAVSKAINIGGHNDFIEVLFDFGLIGLILYLSFWWSLIQRIREFAPKTDVRLAYIVSLIVYAAASIFSNFINTQIEMLFFVMFWGITYNQINNKQ